MQLTVYHNLLKSHLLLLASSLFGRINNLHQITNVILSANLQMNRFHARIILKSLIVTLNYAELSNHNSWIKSCFHHVMNLFWQWNHHHIIAFSSHAIKFPGVQYTLPRCPKKLLIYKYGLFRQFNHPINHHTIL